MRRLLPLLILLAAGTPLTAQEEIQPLTPGTRGVTFPQLLSAPDPVYPQAAARAGIHGTVTLAYVVLASGEVDRITVVDATADYEGDNEPSAAKLAHAREDFAAAARRALDGRRYAPAMRKARPVPVTMEVEFHFSPEERLSLHRWQQVEKGLRTLAEANLIPPGAGVAGRDGVSYPVAIKQKAPVQPHGAQLRNVSSRVLLLVVVGVDGSVAEVPLARAEVNDYPFAEAAEQAVRRWRFAPAEKDGKPVSAYHWLQMTIPPVRAGR